ncbi:MAG: HEAT repeat domain-containing protein [Planctomycetes bacterium]|nr:HEAT repeat domain-containing protein [Planctomycetota bacterium]
MDRKVCELVYEAAGYPDTRTEKFFKKWNLDFLLHEKPKPREGDVTKKEMKTIDNAATPALVSLLDDENEDVRREAVKFLECVGDSRAIEPLMQAFQKDQDGLVRIYSAKSLANIGDKRQVCCAT